MYSQRCRFSIQGHSLHDVIEKDSYEGEDVAITTQACSEIDTRPRLSIGAMRILPSDWLVMTKD